MPRSKVVSDQKYRAPALEKGLDILELLAGAAAMPLTTLARDLDKSASEVFRMVQVLEDRGYIRDAGDGYRLTDRAFTVGRPAVLPQAVVADAMAQMQAFSIDVGQACHLVVAAGNEVVVLARTDSPAGHGFSMPIGARRSLSSDASGLLLVGASVGPVRSQMEAHLVAELGREGAGAFLRDAESAAALGVVSRPSQRVPSLVEIAAAIRTREGVIATLSASAAVVGEEPALWAAVRDRLVQAAAEVARR